MADQNLSLVPYATEAGDVVLQHGSAVVLYNTRSKEISLRRSDVIVDAELTKCPLCGRPTTQTEAGTSVEADRPLPSPTDAGLIDPGYFRLLHASQASTHQSSSVTSPWLQLESLGGETTLRETHGRSFPETVPELAPYAQKISSEAFSQNYFKTFFIEEAELGRGGKGVVLLVRHVIDGVDLGRFACKRVPVGDDSEWLRNVLIEVQLLQTLSHMNLVSYRHVWLENFQINTFSPIVPCAFILQQYCNTGDLHRYVFGPQRAFTAEELKHRIRTRSKGQMEPSNDLRGPRRLPFEEIFSFFRDITSGLNYLHRKSYIHRDLKPSNCLLHKTGSHIRVLVSDFGEMQAVKTVRNSTGNTGTISFCAPEVLRETAPGTFGNFSQKSDVFSLGLIVYLMCFGRLPYANADTAAEENEDIDRLKDEISAWTGMDLDHRDRSDLPERLYKFLKLLLSVDPDERPGTEEILQSIKVGSALHEQGQMRSTSGVGLRECEETPGENDRGVAGVIPATSESRRRQSTLAWPSPPVETKGLQAETYRTNSPRRPSGPIQQTVGTDVVKRQPSMELGTLKHSPAAEQRLLTAPQTRRETTRQYVRSPGVWSGGKLLVFCFKLWTCLRPCSPSATRAEIAYPLLGMAALDLMDAWGTKGRGRTVSLLFLVVHVCTICWAQHVQCLCETKNGNQGDIHG